MDELHRRTASSGNDWERLDLSHEVDLAAERPIDDRPVRSKASPTVIALSVVAVSLVTAFTVDGVRSWRRSQRAGSEVATGEHAAASTSATVETSTSESAVPPPAPQAVDAAEEELRLRYARGQIDREEFLQRKIDLER